MCLYLNNLMSLKRSLLFVDLVCHKHSRLYKIEFNILPVTPMALNGCRQNIQRDPRSVTSVSPRRILAEQIYASEQYHLITDLRSLE